MSSFNTLSFLTFWKSESNVSPSFVKDGLGGRITDDDDDDDDDEEEEEESLRFLLLLLLPELVLLSLGAIFAVCGFRMFIILCCDRRGCVSISVNQCLLLLLLFLVYLVLVIGDYHCLGLFLLSCGI